MEPSTIAVLTTLGVPGLLAAVAYAVRAIADARVKNAEAAATRAATERARTAGAEADAAQIRDAFADMRGRLDRCEKRHEDCEARVVAVETKCEAEHAAKDSQIAALWRECGELRTSIESGSAR